MPFHELTNARSNRPAKRPSKKKSRSASGKKSTGGYSAEDRRALDWFMGKVAGQIHPHDQVVWLQAWRFKTGTTVRIGYAQLSRLTGISEKSVQRAVRRLEAEGLLVRKARGQRPHGQSEGVASTYTIHASWRRGGRRQ